MPTRLHFLINGGLLLFALGGLLWLSPELGLLPPLYYYNTSPSVPVGAYLYTSKWPPERGDIVMLHSPPPPWPEPVLLKRVEGVGGDCFCWHPEDNRHYVNDRPMLPIPPEAAYYHLNPWTGCRVLEADEIVGYGVHVLAFGSQYTGPVRLADLWGVYERWQ